MKEAEPECEHEDAAPEDHDHADHAHDHAHDHDHGHEEEAVAGPVLPETMTVPTSALVAALVQLELLPSDFHGTLRIRKCARNGGGGGVVRGA